ncbi:MAG: YIP1 family protein [Myxococcales bacterium]|nr:YIP1 family protein [Myxococcales bacterium]
MQARCPYCSHVFETGSHGIQFCPNPSCGQQVNVPAPAGAPAAGPACALHPDRASTGPCARCGSFMCEECSLGRQSQLCPKCRALAGGEREPTPWERRAELGLVQALWQTWKKTILTPEKFWVALKPDGSVGEAFLYAWILSSLGAVMQFLMGIINVGGGKEQLEQALRQARDLPSEIEGPLRALLDNYMALMVGILIGSVVLYPLSYIIGAALLHLGALIFGAAKNGFGATARVAAYAAAPAVLAWIPFVGGLMFIYILILQAWGIMKAQETTVGRAIGAVLFFPLLVCCCACGIGVFAGFAAARH